MRAIIGLQCVQQLAQPSKKSVSILDRNLFCLTVLNQILRLSIDSPFGLIQSKTGCMTRDEGLLLMLAGECW